MATRPGLSDIKDAAQRILPYVHRTPILTSNSIDRQVNANLFFKCENFQKVGAFKFRGACNAVFSLTDRQARRGVATHSSGNHAAALSLAARERGATATIVIPKNAPKVKINAIRGYGGKIIFCEPTLEARESTLAEVIKDSGAVFIHSYNDRRVISGQGTAALEVLEQLPDLDVIMAPVGGGGLLSGTAIAVSGLSSSIKVVAAEPEKADDAYRSFHEGRIVPSIKPETICDGLLTSLGNLTFPIIRELVNDIVTVSETAIIKAMRTVWERMKIVIEPSAAVPLGALLENRIDVSGQRVGIIISGGNVDLDRLPWMKQTFTSGNRT